MCWSVIVCADAVGEVSAEIATTASVHLSRFGFMPMNPLVVRSSRWSLLLGLLPIVGPSLRLLAARILRPPFVDGVQPRPLFGCEHLTHLHEHHRPGLVG